MSTETPVLNQFQYSTLPEIKQHMGKILGLLLLTEDAFRASASESISDAFRETNISLPIPEIKAKLQSIDRILYGDARQEDLI